MDDFAEIQKLRRELTQAGYEYYVLDKPTMSDYDYDHMLRRLDRKSTRLNSSHWS